MLRCIAIDDEYLSIDLLKDYISKVPFLELAGTYNDPLDAIEILNKQEVDLIFLDIVMQDISGIDFFKSLHNKPMCIFISANKNYAADGFDLDVIDFLIKPVPLPRFIKACNKAQEWQKFKAFPVSDSNKPSYFFVNIGYSLVKVIIQNIAFVEGYKEYIKIYSHNNLKPLVTRMSMKAIEEILPYPDFLRVHKSYIVSRSSVSEIKKTNLLIGKHEIPTGDTYREVIMKIINNP